MGTKSFFNKQKSQEAKIRGQEKSTINDAGQNVESINYIKEYTEDKLNFIPELDFQDPSNFVKYGLAEDYYVDLVDSIVQSYPYDGSLAERLKYRNGLPAIQKHEFDKNYPRTTGYADFTDSIYDGSLSTPFTVGSTTFTFGGSEGNGHYILTDNYSNKLVYNTGSNQVGSVELDFSDGVTVEFWLKKGTFPDATDTKNEVIFSISNTENDLFQITTDVTASTKILTSFSKALTNTEFSYNFETNLSNIADNTWHHYALTFSTNSAGYVGEIYVDGNFQEKKYQTKASPVLLLTGTLDATVAASSLSGYLGEGGLLGEIDEVRLWKTNRDAKQIGINYFFDVGGGGNTDTAKVNEDSPLELSLYYKFNEGNTGDSSVDSIVLDYSGRLTDAVWVGYNTDGHTSRPTGSAITESGVATEVASPIIYSTNPDVVAYRADKQASGSNYDAENLGNMYNMMPQWIRDDDAANGLLIRKMVQIMSTYLDTLHAQITAISQLQDGSYVSGSNAKPNPFSKRNLISYGFDIPDVFIDPGVIEEIYFKDEKRLYEDKIFNLKNLIFQNIFNNLNYINKSKGTEKSFRNLFRCFGVDDELVRLNMYADNQEYEIRENYETSLVKRNVVDLSGYNDGQNREVVVYQFADPSKSAAETGDSGYLSSSVNAYIPLTFENQFQFPKFVNFPNGYLDKLERASLFGVHSASADTTQTTIPVGDVYFKVYADTNSINKTQFVLETNIGSIGSLTSSFYEDVYDNTNWTFAVRTKPKGYPYAKEVIQSDILNLEFYGVNYVAGYKLNEFTVSSEVNISDGIGQFLTGSNKRMYVGADRENITGSLNYKSNTRLVSSRVWFDYLTNNELSNHARDVSGFGRLTPQRNSFIFEGDEKINYIPRIQTLGLHWNYENITGSGTTGKFLVQDITSGSSITVDDRYGAGNYSKFVGPNYSGQGAGVAPNSTKVVDFLFVDAAKQQLPENLYSSDLVEIREGDDSLFTRESRPSKYYFAVETSLYDTISREMLGFFASISDFNSLIGNPVNMYRPNYKNLEKLRELFFENIKNDPDLDKFVNLYKWLDGALESVISNLIPASSKTSDKVRNIVESHILERSKYIHKYISLKEYKKEDFIKPPEDNPCKGENCNDPSLTIPASPDLDLTIPAGNNINISKKLPEEIRKAKRRRERTSLRPKPKASELPYITQEIRAPNEVSTMRQGDATFWYNTRVERGPGEFLASGVDSVDVNRAQTRINQFQVVTGSRQTPYVFRADATRAIGTNVGFAGENRKNYFPNSFRVSSGTVGQDGISMHVRSTVTNVHGKPYYDYEEAPDKTYDDNRITPLSIIDQTNERVLSGQKYLPFDVLSASKVTSAYQQYLFDRNLEIKIETKHRDFNGVEGSNLQGPFTEENVGGYMYRHGNLLETDPRIRKEGYQLNIVESTPTTIHLNNPRMVSASSNPEPEYLSDRPLGFWLRETAAKRPVNIKNISGSNYFKDYEIIQTSGRRENNRYYVKSNGFTGSVNASSSLSYDEDGLFFFKDFRILDREHTGSNKFVIVNRFSAPGGPEVNSLAYLDVEAAEYSAYNNLNYRNLIVRLDNNELLTRHTLSGGYDSVLLQPSGAFYKTQRNGVYRLSDTLDTPQPIFDNSYVGHGIPRTDVQYRWVASSWIARKTGYPNNATLHSTSGLLTGTNVNPAFHQNTSDFNPDISSSDYSPIYGYIFSDNIRYIAEGHIEYGVGSNIPVSVAFNGTNYVIVGDVILDKNLFTTASTSDGPGDYYNLPEFSAATAPYVLNGLLLSNNGPYQHPTFKQIRGGEHRVGREYKRKNIYRNQIDVLSDDRQRLERFGAQFSVNQTPVTSKFKPVQQFIDEGTGTIQYELGNDLCYYANVYEAPSNEIKDYSLELDTPAVNIYNTDFYKFSQKFNIINYKETVYPKDENVYKESTRERLDYVSFWISDDLEVRTASTFVNSQGYTINGSQWSMDVSISGSFQEEKSGELMRNTGSNGDPQRHGEANARYMFESTGSGRPNNLVQAQAGTGAFYTSYDKFAEDTRLIGQDQTIIPEFAISDFIHTIISENDGDFLKEEVYGFSLTGSDTLSGNSFSERYGKTEKITYLEQLKDFYGEPTAIRLTFDTTKKLLPKTGFYPQQRVIQLAQQFSSSHANSEYALPGAFSGDPVPLGSNASQETTLMPFWAPGIGLNSIKAGFAVEFPYKSATAQNPSASMTEAYNSIAPFEAIITPSEYVSRIEHIVNSGSTQIDSSGSVNRSDGIYELMAHNFFAEVPEFFLDDLTNFKSSPEEQWQFEGPLSVGSEVKKFAMDITIVSPSEFIQYGNPAAFGPFPYNHHAPPGSYTQATASPVKNIQNVGVTRGGFTKATLVFDPTNLLSTTNRRGQTTFSLADIVANSTIEHTSYLSEAVAGADFMKITASIDMFELGEEDRWTIRSKWECPVLNFVNVTATTFGPGEATQGMWHQYGELASAVDRKRVHISLDETTTTNPALTGSLIQAVGFEPTAKAFGKIKPRQVIEEAVCAVPFFVDCKTGEEKFFELPINIFENRYSLVRNNQVTEDSISNMITKMDKYVLPPVYDFVHTRDEARQILRTKQSFEPAYPPFAMYFFEFSSDLTKQDLANIWQGVMPEIATKAQKQKVVLEHPIVDGELLSPTIFRYNGLNSIPNDIRWKMFKVKKRANYDYYKMLENKTGVRAYKTSGASRFSYNYPYDQFSLVELGKMDVEFEVRNDNPNRIKQIAGGGYIKPEDALAKALNLGQPIEVNTQLQPTSQVETSVCSDEDARELQLLINKSQPTQSALGGPIGGTLTPRESNRLQELLRKCPRPEPVTEQPESFEFVPLPETFIPFTSPEPEPEREPEREPEFTSPEPERTAAVVSTPATTFATAAVASFEAVDFGAIDTDSPDPESVEAGDPALCTDEELAELAALIEDSNVMGDEFPLDQQRRLTELQGKC